MKKIKNLANMNYLWLLLGSYFIVVLFNLLRFSTADFYLKLIHKKTYFSRNKFP